MKQSGGHGKGRRRGTLDITQEGRQRGRRHPRNTRRRTERDGPCRRELLAHFGREPADLGIVQICGEAERLVATEGPNVRVLSLQIPRIPAVGMELLDDGWVKACRGGKICATRAYVTSGSANRSIAVRRTPS